MRRDALADAAFRMSAVAAVPAQVTLLPEFADGTVSDEFEDASRSPVPSEKGLVCMGAAPGLGETPSALGSRVVGAVVTRAAFPLRPTLAFLTSLLSSPSSSAIDCIDMSSDGLGVGSSINLSSKKASGLRGVLMGEGSPQLSGIAALDA